MSLGKGAADIVRMCGPGFAGDSAAILALAEASARTMSCLPVRLPVTSTTDPGVILAASCGSSKISRRVSLPVTRLYCKDSARGDALLPSSSTTATWKTPDTVPG